MEDLPLFANNGKPETKFKQEKPTGAAKSNAEKDSAAGKQKVKIVEPNKDVKPKEDDDDSEEDVSVEDVSADEDMSDYNSCKDKDESDSDEERPKKVETGKKRAVESVSKTLVPDKMAKMATPQRTASMLPSVVDRTW